MECPRQVSVRSVKSVMTMPCVLPKVTLNEMTRCVFFVVCERYVKFNAVYARVITAIDKSHNAYLSPGVWAENCKPE